jgi:hypothetical protein
LDAVENPHEAEELWKRKRLVSQRAEREKGREGDERGVRTNVQERFALRVVAFFDG